MPNNVSKYLRGHLRGQDQFIPPVVNTLSRWENGLHEGEDRPAGTFLLVGPTGTGKSFAADCVAKGMGAKPIVVDCAEYANSHDIAKLVGAPPGYLGHRETHPIFGPDTLNANASQEVGLSVVVFDEIEKGDDALFNLILGITGEKGQLRLGDNRIVKWRKTLVFFTSNLGARDRRRGGFDFGQTDPMKGLSVGEIAARKFFTPEFLNRIDHVIPFNELQRADVKGIIRRFEGETNRKFKDNLRGATKLQVWLDEGAVDFLIEKSQVRLYGARDIRRNFSRFVLDPVSNYITAVSRGDETEWPTLGISRDGDGLDFWEMTMEQALGASIEMVESRKEHESVFAAGAIVKKKSGGVGGK